MPTRIELLNRAEGLMTDGTFATAEARSEFDRLMTQVDALSDPSTSRSGTGRRSYSVLDRDTTGDASAVVQPQPRVRRSTTMAMDRVSILERAELCGFPPVFIQGCRSFEGADAWQVELERLPAGYMSEVIAQLERAEQVAGHLDARGMREAEAEEDAARAREPIAEDDPEFASAQALAEESAAIAARAELPMSREQASELIALQKDILNATVAKR